jgi:hypothetical protein
MLRLFESGKTYSEIAKATGLTLTQVASSIKKMGLGRQLTHVTGEKSFPMPNTDFKPVPLKEIFSRCPNCGGTVNLDGHAMISFCEGACGQEWRIDGTPIPREEWLRLVMV